MRPIHKILIPVILILLTAQVISEYFYLETIKASLDEPQRVSLGGLRLGSGSKTSLSKNTIPEKSSKYRNGRIGNGQHGNKKLILFGSKWWFDHYPYLAQAEKMCPKCVFTEDLNLFNVSDAVVFHGLTIPRTPPVNDRPIGQVWIWLMLEAPDTRWDRNKFAENYTDLINWTMTYRKDSDICVPYGEVIANSKMLRPSFEETWAFMPSDIPSENVNELYDDSVFSIPTVEDLQGRKMVAWIASNCKSPSRREKIVRALRKYMPIDVYGYCGTLECQFERPDRTASGNLGIDCRIEMSTKYKFYLALENAVCEDYVTEKYFDTLFTQMIPIVYGGLNYSAEFPPKSFINVNDFASVADLAEYLQFLDQNPKEFLKYFEWKKHYWVKNNGYVTGYCALCEKLWRNENPQKSYKNLEEWWFRRSDYNKSRKPSCMKMQDFLFKKQNL